MHEVSICEGILGVIEDQARTLGFTAVRTDHAGNRSFFRGGGKRRCGSDLMQ